LTIDSKALTEAAGTLSPRLKPRPKPSRKTGRRNRVAGQFTTLPLDMLQSPAWRVLSLSAHRVIYRVSIELRQHAGNVGDGLCVTYDDFEEYGIHRHAVAAAIREAVALGFLEIMRPGRAGNAEYRRATLYRPTFEMRVDGEPTHEWRQIKTLEQAMEIAAKARGNEKPFPVADSAPQVSAESTTEKGRFHSADSATTSLAFTATTLESLGGGGDETPRPPPTASESASGAAARRRLARGRRVAV
jgi:hypothetical protein